MSTPRKTPGGWTPGPWAYIDGAVFIDPRLGPSGAGIAQRIVESSIRPHERDRNMRLCSLAPDLYEAMRALYVQCCNDLERRGLSYAKHATHSMRCADRLMDEAKAGL